MSSSTIVSPGLANPEVPRPKPHNLKVIGASLPRTGSMSMYTAMNELGLKCHHMKELFGNPQQVPLWTKAHTEGLSPAEWDELLEGYSAIHDSPGSQFVKELAVLNPEAKIIITSRDPRAWVKSLRSTVCWLTPGIDSMIVWLLWPKEREVLHMMSLIWWGPKGIFANRSSIDENAITEYIKDIQDFFEKRGVEKPEGKAWPNVNASTGSENSKNAQFTFEQITQGELKRKEKIVRRVRTGLNGLGLVTLVGGVAVIASYWQKGGFGRR